MWFEQCNRYQTFVLFFVLVYNGCEAISNANFNEQIRDYSVINNDGNQTHVKTLQNENIGLDRYASFAPLQHQVEFKEVPDSALSGSSHGRGLLHHDHTGGYGVFEYEDPHYNPGYEYNHDLDHHEPHGYHHYDFHDPHHATGHHGGYGHHHKHYDHHALAAKTLLWPIAGIALLGAAAALVSNPVLLQLGVVSGRKKRQIENLEFVKDSIKKWSSISATAIKKSGNQKYLPEFIVKRKFINNDLRVEPTEKSKAMEHKSLKNNKILKVSSKRYKDEDEERMVPVPLIFRKS